MGTVQGGGPIGVLLQEGGGDSPRRGTYRSTTTGGRWRQSTVQGGGPIGVLLQEGGGDSPRRGTYRSTTTGGRWRQSKEGDL